MQDREIIDLIRALKNPDHGDEVGIDDLHEVWMLFATPSATFRTALLIGVGTNAWY